VPVARFPADPARPQTGESIFPNQQEAPSDWMVLPAAYLFYIRLNVAGLIEAAELHGLHDAVAVHLQMLFHLEGFFDRDLDDAALLRADDAVAAAFHEGIDGIIAHAGRGLAVAGVRRAAALDMAENGHARADAKLFLDLLADVEGMTRALGHDDHKVRVAGQAGILDTFDDVLLEVDLALRHQDGRCTDGDADVQRQEAGVATHDLDDRAALVRLHRVAQTVDAFDGRVAGSVKADRVIRAAHVVVDRGGHADDGDAET